MEKYFSDGTRSDEDLIPGIKAAATERRLFPILVASGIPNIGIQPLLASSVELAPARAHCASVFSVVLYGAVITSEKSNLSKACTG